ncbi:MAG: HU family DNA-binding protein, partial [Bacteroidales bacterium]
MLKSELIIYLSDKYQLPRKVVLDLMADTIQFITDNVLGGDSLTLDNFGTFQLKERKACTRMHPLTKVKMNIPARKVIVF